MVGIFREKSKGKLKDGRYFKIIDFRNFALSDNGEIHSGVMGVKISEKKTT